MIKLNPEPDGHLLQRADIMTWVEGLTIEEWKKIRPCLPVVNLPGCRRSYYRKADIKQKLVEPIINAS